MAVLRGDAGNGEGGVKRITIDPGKAYRLKFDGAERSSKFHVRAIVDDSFAVVREWSARGKGWRYRIEFLPVLEMWIEGGLLTRA